MLHALEVNLNSLLFFLQWLISFLRWCVCSWKFCFEVGDIFLGVVVGGRVKDETWRRSKYFWQSTCKLTSFFICSSISLAFFWSLCFNSSNCFFLSSVLWLYWFKATWNWRHKSSTVPSSWIRSACFSSRFYIIDWKNTMDLRKYIEKKEKVNIVITLFLTSSLKLEYSCFASASVSWNSWSILAIMLMISAVSFVCCTKRRALYIIFFKKKLRTK